MVEIKVKGVEITESRVDEFVALFKAFIIDAFRDTKKPGENGRANHVWIDYKIRS